MVNEKLNQKLDISILDNGGIVFNSKEVSIRDAALTYYYFIRKSEANKSTSFLKNASCKVQSGEADYYDVVFWLWVLGEYVNSTKDNNILELLNESIKYAIDFIEAQWQKPRSNWLGASEEGLYITNIAMAFGALQSINNSLKDDKALQLQMNIKKYMFSSLLSGGKVISKIGDKEIFGDINLIAIPFGLLDAGNQILVESVNIVERELVTNGIRYSKGDMYFGGCVRTDLTCLMSWYYSEKGDIAKAKFLLDRITKIWDRDGKLFTIDKQSTKEDLLFQHWLEKNNEQMEEHYLSYILYLIAQQNIDLKESFGAASGDSLKVIHNPKGIGNPYNSEHSERYPRDPEENEQVFLKIITQPFNLNQQVEVRYSVNGEDKNPISLKADTSTDGEKYWHASIGSFSFSDDVKYSFVVNDGTGEYNSEKYSFKAKKWMPVGAVSHYTATENEIKIYFETALSKTKKAFVRIQKQNDSIAKWSLGLEEKNFGNSEAKLTGDIISLGFNGWKLNVDLMKMDTSIFDNKNTCITENYKIHGEKFLELLTDGSGDIFKIRCKFLMSDDERIFGMGERYSHIEYRGLNIDNYVFNQYRSQGLKTYIPVPFAISSKGYGIYLDTTFYSIFRFGTKLSDMLEFDVDLDKKKQCCDFYILLGGVKEVVQQFSNISGKAVLPPKWTFGPWMSSNNWDSQAETYKQVELTKKYEIPATVLVLEQWSDEATFYIFNDAQYELKNGNDYLKYEDFTFPEWGRWPGPKKMVEDIHNDGIKVLLWQAPVQKFMDGIAHEQRDEDEAKMLENGYYLKHVSGKPYRIPSFEWFKRSLVPDFTNPEANEWWLNKRLYLMKDLGIDGFKTDGGECVYGDDVVFFDGRLGDEMRNAYPNLYIEKYYEFVQKHTGNQGITFSRAGYTGAQKIPLHWAGDERSTYEAFRCSLRAGLNSGMSGIPFWGWDIAGFNGGIPTAELFIRATQMAAFCPIMQYHAETKGEFNQDRTPWNIAERTGKAYVIDIYKKYADLRMNLLPYIYSQAILSSNTGIPLMRAMFLEYPNDNSCIAMTEQYFFGESLLVAPVMEENCYIKNVYLPEGDWMEFFSGRVIKGNKNVRVKVEIDNIPVFIKQNSILPLNLSNNYSLSSHVSNNVDSYVNLCFMIYLKDRIEYCFLDDLGNVINIQASNSSKGINMQLRSQKKVLFNLIIGNISGNYKVKCNNETFLKVNALNEFVEKTFIIDEDRLIIKLICLEEMKMIDIEKL